MIAIPFGPFGGREGEICAPDFTYDSPKFVVVIVVFYLVTQKKLQHRTYNYVYYNIKKSCEET